MIFANQSWLGETMFFQGLIRENINKFWNYTLSNLKNARVFQPYIHEHKWAHGSYKYTFEFACTELQSSTKYFETLQVFGKVSIHHYYKLNPYNFIRNILRKIKKSSKLGNTEKL